MLACLVILSNAPLSSKVAFPPLRQTPWFSAVSGYLTGGVWDGTGRPCRGFLPDGEPRMLQAWVPSAAAQKSDSLPLEILAVTERYTQVRKAELPDVNVKATVGRMKPPKVEVHVYVCECGWFVCMCLCILLLSWCVWMRVLGCVWAHMSCGCVSACVCVCPGEPSIRKEWFCLAPNSKPHFKIKGS